MFENMNRLQFSVEHLSIIVLLQVVSQFSNFLNFADDDEKRLVGLQLAAPQAINRVPKLHRQRYVIF